MKKLNTSIQATAPIFEKIGMLTRLQRILICGVSFLVLVGSFVYFSYLPKMEKVQELEKERSSLESQLATAQVKARQLAQYRERKQQAEADFMVAKKLLPEKKEIPSLLTGISQSGQDAGLEFLTFQPQNEIVKDFYAEIPVSIKVTGGYHNVAVFFDNVSRLYRIVNMKDLEMKAEQKANMLTTTCTAVTYRFVESEKKTPDGGTKTPGGDKKEKRSRR
ncbi:MAG: type 4a pilus biogenesis protein PilO [Pseudomonadota bacterium]